MQVAGKIARRYDGRVAFLLFGRERNNSISDLKELATQEEIVDRVHFMGFRTPVEPCIAGCDIVIAPAYNEGFGRSLVESMIVGTPVVASNSGGHKEIIRHGDSGLLATVDDPEAIADAAVRLLGNASLRDDIAARAQRQAIDSYSIESHVEEMMLIYTRCQDPSAPASPSREYQVGQGQ
jgi:glycosyltransferase involved in cell wall biosynthesis